MLTSRCKTNPFSPNLPLGWTRYDNPEGSPLFYNKDKASPVASLLLTSAHQESQNVITEAWIYEPEELGLVEKFTNFLLKERDAFEQQEDAAQFTSLILKDEEELYGPGDAPDLSHTQLFIELKKIPNYSTECHYYFADDRARNIFWLEELGFPVNPILDTIAGKLEPEGISTFLHCDYPHSAHPLVRSELAIERQYW
jgi:hypothetical protein